MSKEIIVTENEMQHEVSCNLKYLAASVTRERVAKQMSVYQLAKLAGTSQSTVHKLERGEQSRVDTVIRVVRALGIRLILL